MNPCGSPAPCCCMGPNMPSLLRSGKGVVYAEIHHRSAAKRTSYGELPSRRHTLVHSIASQVGVSHRENDILLIRESRVASSDVPHLHGVGP